MTMLRKARRLENYTQRELSQLAGVSEATISRLERGVAADTLKNELVRQKISEFLKLDGPADSESNED